jgi:hypothetical protein
MGIVDRWAEQQKVLRAKNTYDAVIKKATYKNFDITGETVSDAR